MVWGGGAVQGVVIERARERAAAKAGQRLGEVGGLGEAAVEGVHMLGELGEEPGAEGLIWGVGVGPLGGVVERLGARGRPDENAPEHVGAARRGVAELEDIEAVGDGLGKNFRRGYGPRGRGVDFHRTQAPSLEAIADTTPLANGACVL